jgi:putative ABC transport system permease protein
MSYELECIKQYFKLPVQQLTARGSWLKAFSMLKNYFKIAWRNLWKQKSYSFINLFGLTTGFVCFLLIALYLFDELTYDSFHKQTGNIYRVVEEKTTTAGGTSKVATTAYNVSAQAKMNLPATADVCRFVTYGRVNILNNENSKVFYEDYTMADASFLKIFDFPVVQGDPHTALVDPFAIVITNETALKIFGEEKVVGKVIRIENDKQPYKITAVVKVPGNSHLRFNLLISEATDIADSSSRKFMASDWSSNTFNSYVLLKPGASPVTLATGINKMVAANRHGNAANIKSSFLLQPIKDIHFHSANIERGRGGGNIMHLYVFAVVGFFVLLIACINYMNLATARFSSRSKEIAVRKVAGAAQKNLILQFITEALLLTVLSLLVSLIIVKLLLPAFNAFTEKQLQLTLHTDYRIWLGIVLITLFAGLLAGAYPAFFQSRLKPYLLLKNKLNTGKGHLSIRRALVVVQFSLSIIMIIATAVVYLQLKYVSNKDMGFNKSQLMVIDINSGKVRRGAETIKAEFARLSAVKDVTVTSRVPGEWKNIPKVNVVLPGKTSGDGESMYFIGADDKFINTYAVQLLQGRNFMAAYNADSGAVLINETAARQLGIKTITEQAIAIPSANWGGDIELLRNPFNARIVGIVKDFNFRSLRETVAPLVIGYRNNPIHNIDYFTARVDAAHVKETLSSMETILHSIDPSHLFEYNFLDKQWSLFYREDEKRQVIFLVIAAMTILIACLGLFGLVTFSAEQRTKEIGIRKVLGASVGSIVMLLSKDFLRLVLVSAVIALPLAGWAMQNWLHDFAYRVSIGWWLYLVVAVLALTIALATVSIKAIRAALMKPAKSLRTE